MTIEEYLKAHGLKEELVKTLGWSWNDNTLTIPIFDKDGTRMFNRYRHLDYEKEKERGNPNAAKFSADEGSHPALYCLHKIRKFDTIVLCEGEPDCAKLWQEEIPAITGTSGVKTIKPELVASLKGKKVILTLDTDESGVSSVEKYYEILTQVGVSVAIKELPQEFKDISEYFVAGHTKEEYLALPEINIDDFLINHEPKDFALETASDIRKKELPEEKWLINKVIPKEGFTFFVGPEASSKSYQALSIAKSVVTGEPWLAEKLDKDGNPLFKVMKKTKVLIMDKESTMRRIQDRLRGYELDTNDIYFLAYPQELEITDRATQKDNGGDGYTDFIKSVAIKVRKLNIGLIILDSFTDFFVGDENDRKEVQDFFDAFRQLFPDVAILPLHHAGKQQMGRQRPTSQLPRGSSNIMAQTYTAFHFEPVKKDIRQFTIEQTKAGDSLKMPKFIIESVVIDDAKHEGETLVAGFKYVEEAGPTEKAKAIDETIDTILEYLQDENEPPLKPEMYEALIAEHCKEGNIDKALTRMEEDGLIKRPYSKKPGKKQYKEIVLIEKFGKEYGEKGDLQNDIFYE